MNEQVKQLNRMEEEKEVERIRRLPTTILVDFIRSNVNKRIKEYEEMKVS